MSAVASVLDRRSEARAAPGAARPMLEVRDLAYVQADRQWSDRPTGRTSQLESSARKRAAVLQVRIYEFQADFVQKAQPRTYLIEQSLSNFRLLASELQLAEELGCVLNRHRANITDISSLNSYLPRF